MAAGEGTVETRYRARTALCILGRVVKEKRATFVAASADARDPIPLKIRHDRFLDGSFDLSRALPELPDMRVVNRVINEAQELQMDKTLRTGEDYGLPGHGFHHRGWQHVSWLEFHGLSLLAFAILDRFTSSRLKRG